MLPDRKGHFDSLGGRFVSETLVYALEELEKAYMNAKRGPSFKKELSYYLSEYAGRPTPLYLARNLSNFLNPSANPVRKDFSHGVKIYLKREDLLHTGAHKINNTLAQILLARRMKKTRIIAETGAGQHGVATATACSLFNLPCFVYMGEEDIKRQSINVFRMKLLGAEVIPVKTGSRTLKDAISEALRDWVTNVRSTYYCLGSVVGPHPYPAMVRDFQSVIGQETKRQILKYEKRLPDYLLACVGGGSNAMGLFYPFYKDKAVKFIGVEAAGEGLNTHRHSATLCKGDVGILHGSKSYVLQDEDGQIETAHSIAAGLDYPGVGPEHSFYKNTARAEYVSVNDKEALEGFRLLSELEGIIPALEPAHAIYYLKKLAPRLKKNSLVVVCLSGRGDKDIDIVKSEIRISSRTKL